MRPIARLAGLALGFAGLTALVGWWSVPLLAAVWSRRARGAPHQSAIEASLGAAMGWGIVLAWDAASGPAGTLAHRVGGVFLLPGWGFLVATLGFGAVLAAAAALAAAPSKIRARERSPGSEHSAASRTEVAPPR